MFGFRNFTGIAFVGKVGKFGLEVTVGFVEEITFNITTAAAAHGAEIPENVNVKLISKDQFVKGAAVVSSKIAQTKLLEIIAGATPNLFI